jgi:hypothetical protein
MAAGWQTRLNGLPVLLTVPGPSPGTRPAAFPPAATQADAGRLSGLAGNRPAPGRRSRSRQVATSSRCLPSRRPRHGALARQRSLASTHSTGSRHALRGPGPPARRPRTRAGTASARKTQPPRPPRPVPRMKVKTVCRPPPCVGRARPGPAEMAPRVRQGSTPGTAKVHTRYIEPPVTGGEFRAAPVKASRSHSLPTAR